MNKTVFDLYCDYKRELWSYTGEHYEDELLREWYDMLVADPSCMIYPIVRFGKSIGFVILQTINCEIPKYIIDAYVMPKYRKQGYMTLLLDSMRSMLRTIGNVRIKASLCQRMKSLEMTMISPSTSIKRLNMLSILLLFPTSKKL